MTEEIDKISEMVKNKSKEYTILYRYAHSQVGSSKSVGLMRLGMILDIMQKAVSQDRIDSNCVQIERYYGMLPILRKE